MKAIVIEGRAAKVLARQMRCLFLICDLHKILDELEEGAPAGLLNKDLFWLGLGAARSSACLLDIGLGGIPLTKGGHHATVRHWGELTDELKKCILRRRKRPVAQSGKGG